MRALVGTVICILLSFPKVNGQSALELKVNSSSFSFEHWYFNTLDSLSTKLSLYTFTSGVWNFDSSSENSSFLSPFLGIDLWKGIGLAAGGSFSQKSVEPSLGIQFSDGNSNSSLYSLLSFSPSQPNGLDVFLWYFYQPLKKGWKPFFQVSASSKFITCQKTTAISISLGPSYGSNAIGAILDLSWNKNWKGSHSLGLFYRYQLQ
ncbi:hypothetical protein [Algoriphagus marincola]|jgi:hypothetical protein|uniref:hypothetical protein n=1 Tax=Algoriphagus marincola TaxID=264027 RepID=UPI0004074D1D|nr:hypothetical protein [Algoriphagus marincola]